MVGDMLVRDRMRLICFGVPAAQSHYTSEAVPLQGVLDDIPAAVTNGLICHGSLSCRR